MADTTCDDGTHLATLASPTRNRYFYAKLLDAFHFDLEQSYGNRKRWLLNRLGTGAGVLCGLDVVPTNNGAGIVVSAGVALDEFGREIVVPVQSPAVDPRQPTDGCGRPYGAPVTAGTVVTICLAYHECETEPVPAMVCDCEGDDGCQASSIRERYMVLVRAGEPPNIETGCQMPGLWHPAEGDGLALTYDTLVTRVSGACPVPSEPCVVLATVTVPAAGEAITAAAIDRDVRSVVYTNDLLFDMITCLASETGQGGGGVPDPLPATDLGWIDEISWTHDGAMDRQEFLAGLRVHFSRQVVTSPATPRTWFTVTLEVPVLREEPGPPFLPHSVHVVRVLDRSSGLASPDTALFEPEEATFVLIRQLLEVGEPLVARIRVDCDFLLDEQGVAIDGDHLGGKLPTGDGVAGGTFESWFTLG